MYVRSLNATSTIHGLCLSADFVAKIFQNTKPWAPCSAVVTLPCPSLTNFPAFSDLGVIEHNKPSGILVLIYGHPHKSNRSQAAAYAP